ncbi:MULTISPECIES: carbohydrate ABC transporter permease [Paenibacillus]|jgi:putative aldouronate transport system permease protein|uniref:Carbohydrate ABC transporter permease n=1 Tax=Paenibacillus baimaensis TaxID=2982185 RepID=A0ABT2UK64_9BACL|nr:MULTISPECIES: carbohydrate ABC transporter permease [unclassified Paenibacillus]MCU6795029.1 carbohydrate ABC transporter permease [Paenibacillus sp. WQ 127069]OMF08959.1 ABC transporter permease [Paenibacillus sp. FSL H7-0331]
MVNKGLGSRIFDGFNYTFLFVFALITIIPFIYIVSVSFAEPEEVLRRGFILFPTTFSLEGYRYIFSTDTIVRSLFVTIGITVAGTLINLIFTSLLAYPLSRQDFDGRKLCMMLIVFTMLFNGGILPTFIVVKAMGLLNSYWALLIPNAISAFNLIVIVSFFRQLPDGLEEAAKIDGCSDPGILVRIVLPLSAPVLATFALFYAVGHWNTFFSAILYINDSKMWPIQVWLRQIVILSQGGIGDSTQFDQNFVALPPQIIKMAVIVISTVPILLVYPFLQKHFAKGVLLGSVKG